MASPTSTLPSRSATTATNRTNSTVDDDAIPDEDSSETSQLFHERLQAWKHAVKYVEDYVSATEKMHHDNSKDYGKVLKSVSSPLKEGHHFDQNLGGVAGLFDNVRSNTQGLVNSHNETASTLKGTVLPIFERLHSEIKNKTKELTKGAGKGSKAVDKARGTSQKHIELLGQHTASYDSSGGSVKAVEDPYVLQRQVYHRLNKQVLEENNNRDDMLAVQNSFAQFEAHIIATLQNGWQQFTQVVTAQAESTRSLYGDMAGTMQRIPPDFEWNGFVKRNIGVLIDPNGPKRAVEHIKFANQDHAATRPLIAGSLERKKMLKRYDAGFYVVTPSKYLHEFKTDDDFAKDPSPENSLYLPDCMIGAVDGVKFNIRGKDASGNAMLNKMARAHEFAFKAHTPDDARKWHSIIASVAGQTSNEMPGDDESPAASPIAGQSEGPVVASSPQAATQAGQTTGTVPASTTAEPGTVPPQSTAAPQSTV
ncbi:Putative pleckstrin domain, PH-like domain superfamily, AH/BAR domain superfamily [Septoria linicola]|uniref:Pleckstrin domain, PH-like domain superfamily, AH/BAR domain superfamily n=1 Tax=Septoria linicola TaxID=215465 RepID=A0A9Q9AL79_9PEZI|nr:putative pleckstrin domain, PH-like domain superfamily, AH/BAR domain superfamily [Septoria linicola]USW48163.1 Putative pleckstrin domain, PH-like domain superfamily, AH/BAR domain superfamily [Septoria linicola]